MVGKERQPPIRVAMNLRGRHGTRASRSSGANGAKRPRASWLGRPSRRKTRTPSFVWLLAIHSELFWQEIRSQNFSRGGLVKEGVGIKQCQQETVKKQKKPSRSRAGIRIRKIQQQKNSPIFSPLPTRSYDERREGLGKFSRLEIFSLGCSEWMSKILVPSAQRLHGAC